MIDVLGNSGETFGTQGQFTRDPLTGALVPVVVEQTANNSSLRNTLLIPQQRTAFLRRDGWVMGQPALRGALAKAVRLSPRSLSEDDLDALLAFLGSLTDEASLDREDLVPGAVPSGLPVED